MANVLKKVEGTNLVNVKGNLEIVKEIEERTPELIANEINNIELQTKTIVMIASVEIGKRLVEAKAKLSHGEWGNWLKSSVAYSKSTANNYMKLFSEYGEMFSNPNMSMANKNLQTLGNLPYSKALQLVSLPKGTREEFIEENNIEDMSSRELQKAVKEKNEALKLRDEALKQVEEVKKTSDKSLKIKVEELTKVNDEKLKKLEKENADWKGKLTSVVEENKKLLGSKENELKVKENEFTENENKLKAELEALNKKIDELNVPIEQVQNETNKNIESIKSEKEKELKALREDKEKELKSLQNTKEKELKAKEKEIENLKKSHEKELKNLKEQREKDEKEIKNLKSKSDKDKQIEMDRTKYKIYFESLVKEFKEVLTILNDIKSLNEVEYQKYKNGTEEFLKKMEGSLK